jgi:hypothetical protein
MFASVAAAAPGEELSYNEYSEWLVQGSPLGSGKTEPISTSLAPYTTMTLTMVYFGTPIETVDCTGAGLAKGSTAYLESGGRAYFGRLELTGCTVSEPTSCYIEGSRLESVGLKFQISGEQLIIEPVNPGQSIFNFSTWGCSVNGYRSFGGKITGDFLNTPRTSMSSQPVVFAGSETTWNMGNAYLNGELLFTTS